MVKLKGRAAGASALALAATLALVSACDRPRTETTSRPASVDISRQDNRVPGPVTVEVPRTGSQSSGTYGSSTVIGAPPKGETGAATAHGAP